MDIMFDRPIPGQSLVDTPRNAPYERPPEVVDPEKALQIHLDRLTDPDMMEGAIFFLEAGVDLVTLVEGILRGAVMGGIHSIDVSMIIAPVIHEYIKSTADALGVEYEEGFEDKEGRDRTTYARNTILAEKKSKDKKPKKSPVRTQKPVAEKVSQPEVTEEQPAGLMARRV